MKKTVISFACLALAAAAFAGGKKDSGADGIKRVTTIAESFGDGEKVSTVIIEYKKVLDPATVVPEAFSVEGRVIDSAYTNNKAAQTAASVSGSFVVLALRYENKWDATGGALPQRSQQGGPGTAEGGPGSRQPGNSPDGMNGTGGPGGMNGAPNGGGMGGGPRFDDDGTPVDLTATVTQVADIRAADGTVYAASATAHTSTAATELVIQDFTKQTYSDSETGITLPYFVYLPQGYSSATKYPIVFFIPDASADTSIDTATLTQGNGGTIWATPAEQAKHPAIVVAIQYPYSVVQEFGALTTDDYVWTTGLTAVHNLIQHVIGTYSVDTSRIYGTGQSQGCMSNIALSDRYPDLFTAQFLVAGQWNVQEMAALKDKTLWIVVCEGDTKAYPAMNEATALWESLGTKVARSSSMWNSKAEAAEQATNIAAMLAQDTSIKYNVFAGGSHMYTWSVAYNIEGIRDWLFAQQR